MTFALLKVFVDKIVNFETNNQKKLVVDDVGGKAYLGINEKFNPQTAQRLNEIIQDRERVSISDVEWEQCLNIVNEYVQKEIIQAHKINTLADEFKFFFIDTLFHSGGEDESIQYLQECYNKYKPEGEVPLVADGIFGAKTRHAFRKGGLDEFSISMIFIKFQSYVSNHLQFSDGFTKRFKWRSYNSLFNTVE